MKPLTRFLLVLIVSMSVIVAFAQPGGGQGRRGGFRGGNDIAFLVMRPDVQADIQLTDDEKTKLNDLRQQMRQQFQNGGGGTPPTPAEQQQRRAEMQKQVEAILTADQIKRLHEIQVQLMGVEAATLPEVQNALGLSDEEKSKIKALADTRQAADQSVREKQRNQEIDAQAARDARATNAKALKDGIQAILSQAQQDKLKELGGKPFVQEQRTGGGGGGGA
jgi:hypothetical protein